MSEEKRVKLYQCNDEGQWADQGTGHVSIVKGPTGRYSIVMRSETEKDASGNFAVVLNTPLASNDVYEVQGETLVVWDDPFMSQHLALSFQSSAGCIMMMESIKAIQQGQVDTDDEAEDEITLPEPEITSLGTLQETLMRVSVLPLPLRRSFSGRIAQRAYLEKLFAIFEQCEDLDDMDALHTLFRIFLAILLLNDLHIFSLLFDASYIMKLMGALEYDPASSKRVPHRQFLQSEVQFREAVQLQDSLKAKIHETFKLQYLKDSVVPKYLDDGSAATLGSLIAGRQADIISELCQDDDVTDAIAKQLSEGGEPERVQVLRLVQEMQTFAKNLPPQGKAEFLATLCGTGIFRTISALMVTPEDSVRRLAVDIISQAAQYEPGVLRGFIIDQEEKGEPCPLLQNVVARLVGDTPDADRVEMVEILRQLLETGPRPPGQAVERAVVTGPEEMAQLLALFYRDCMPTVLQPLLRKADRPGVANFHLVDLLSFCVVQHGDCAKKVVLHYDLIGKATALLAGPGCSLPLMAALVRFLKAVVTAKEDAYWQQLIAASAFKVIIDLLWRHRGRHNLLYSTILALLEVIRRENIKLLIGHLADTLGEALQPLQELDTISSIRRQWGNMKEADKTLVRTLLRPASPPTPALEGVGDGEARPGLVAYAEEDDADTRRAKRPRLASPEEGAEGETPAGAGGPGPTDSSPGPVAEEPSDTASQQRGDAPPPTPDPPLPPSPLPALD